MINNKLINKLINTETRDKKYEVVRYDECKEGRLFVTNCNDYRSVQSLQQGDIVFSFDLVDNDTIFSDLTIKFYDGTELKYSINEITQLPWYIALPIVELKQSITIY